MTLEKLLHDHVEIIIVGVNISKPFFRVTLTKNTSDVRLEVKEQAPTLKEAIDNAIKKWNAYVGGGIKEFTGPLLSHIHDEEIPF